ncbi:hypothetical protein B0H65DRAFT_36406 [Neurospora tetraspora]|uniref:Uncharacterized protein n=1 Tax=Neurospora tetraspora TaxID=94610 RepID=A0AAE0JP52_9PEZI|nr:hypothetical protein B0H65DRAFT_36406 [Neurospora tetraspora]
MIGHHHRFQGLGFWPLFLAWLACRHCLLGTGSTQLAWVTSALFADHGPAFDLMLTLLRLLFGVLDGDGIDSRRRISQELMVSTRALRVRYRRSGTHAERG